ncbi:MAG: hypothetical protein K6B43_10165 [Treponema sp.]|nr:hypothetical protein [Treponema sp.]
MGLKYFPSSNETDDVELLEVELPDEEEPFVPEPEEELVVLEPELEDEPVVPEPLPESKSGMSQLTTNKPKAKTENNTSFLIKTSSHFYIAPLYSSCKSSNHNDFFLIAGVNLTANLKET